MSAYVPVELQRQVRVHFHDCCAYCRSAEHLTVSIFEIEHIKPRSAGGQTVFENLCLACPTCNRFKSDRETSPDPETGAEQELYQPHVHAWGDHFFWSTDGTEILPQTPIGRATVAALRMNRPQLLRVRRLWVALGEHPPK